MSTERYHRDKPDGRRFTEYISQSSPGLSGDGP